jgi:hypothetical protein
MTRDRRKPSVEDLDVGVDIGQDFTGCRARAGVALQRYPARAVEDTGTIGQGYLTAAIRGPAVRHDDLQCEAATIGLGQRPEAAR